MYQSLITRRSRSVSLFVVGLLFLSFLTACLPNAEQSEETKRVLRIATVQGYGADDEWFRSQFTELFEFANPNISIEIVPAIDFGQYRYTEGAPNPAEQKDPLDELRKMMAGDNPPDLVVVDYSQLPELLDDNLLAPLDPYITKDKFDTTKIVPTILDGIKDVATDGKLYALAPLFSSSAMFYNKTIFTDAGVPFPTDGMTWEDVFYLAEQVANGEGKDRKYGFSFTNYQGGDSFWEMQIYTQPLQLRMYDDAFDRLTVDSDQWEQVWKKMAELRKKNLFPLPPDYSQATNKQPGPFDYDNFISGKVAMVIANYYYINEILNANKMAETNESMKTVDWDVVTLPTHPQAPGIGGFITMNGLMGINAKAQNTEDAWRFISFINGPEWARLKSRSIGTLVSHKDYVEPKAGLAYNIEAFTQLKPAVLFDESEIYRKYPSIYEVQSIGQMKFQEVMEGKKEARQALKEWQTEGDALMVQMRENPTPNATPEPLAR